MDTEMDTLSSTSETEGEEPSFSSSAPGGGGIHPLLINHVLDKIFSSPHLDENDLLSSRMVCRSWNLPATKEFRKRGTLYTLHSSCHVKSFMELMEKTQIVPLTKFIFPEEFFIYDNSNIILQFLGRWGPFLERLHFNFVMTFEVVFNYDLFSLGIFNYDEDFTQHFHFPKLKSFTLDFYFKLNTFPIVSVRTLCALAQLILKKSPNIDDLSVWIMVDKETTEDIEDELIQELYPTIISSMSMGKNLKRLVIAMPVINDEHVVLLRDKLMNDEVALEELALILSSEDKKLDLEDIVELSTLVSLLEHQKDSLIELRTSSTTLSLHENNTLFPIFPKLERLRIKDGLGPEMVDMRFLESFPALKVLDMKELANEIQCYVQLTPQNPDPTTFLIPKTIPPVEKLAIYGPSEVLVNIYSRLFPNLRSLVLSHCTYDYQNQVWAVFSKMLQLEELFFDCTEFRHMNETYCTTMDSLLTGIPKEECKIILETRNFEKNIEGDIVPGVHNLTNLKKLVICIRCKSMGSWMGNFGHENFSDVTARLALLKMPNLKNCVLYGSFMTKECLDLLRAKLHKFIHSHDTAPCHACFLGMCNKEDCRDYRY